MHFRLLLRERIQLGAVHKVRNARGECGSEVWQFVTGGARSMRRHAYKFFIIHMKHEI